MGGYFTQLSTEDRWKVLLYSKDLAGIEEGAVAMVEGKDFIEEEAQ